MQVENAESDDDLLLLPEVAQMIRLPVATLRWMRHRGTGPRGFLVGRHVMFRRGEVKKWIKQQEEASAR